MDHLECRNLQLVDHFKCRVTSLPKTQQNADIATATFARTWVDRPLICTHAIFAHDAACKPGNMALNPNDGALLFDSNNYTDPAAANQYVQKLFQQNLSLYNEQQLANATLATSVIGNYLEERVPNKTTNRSFMAQLQQTVTVPTTPAWQQQLNQQTLSDRLRTVAQLLVTQNYLSFLKLQASQKRNVLLATAILQRTQQAYTNSQILLQQRISVENQQNIIRLLKTR